MDVKLLNFKVKIADKSTGDIMLTVVQWRAFFFL